MSNDNMRFTKVTVDDAEPHPAYVSYRGSRFQHPTTTQRVGNEDHEVFADVTDLGDVYGIEILCTDNAADVAVARAYAVENCLEFPENLRAEALRCRDTENATDA